MKTEQELKLLKKLSLPPPPPHQQDVGLRKEELYQMNRKRRKLPVTGSHISWMICFLPFSWVWRLVGVKTSLTPRPGPPRRVNLLTLQVSESQHKFVHQERAFVINKLICITSLPKLLQLFQYNRVDTLIDKALFHPILSRKCHQIELIKPLATDHCSVLSD